jgi:hypothetical protein
MLNVNHGWAESQRISAREWPASHADLDCRLGNKGFKSFSERAKVLKLETLVISL